MLSLPKRYMIMDRTDNEAMVVPNTYKIWDPECLVGFIDIW